MTPIKNQGQCGSCWTFGTTGAVEGIHFIKGGKLVSLSEEEIVDCCHVDGSNGCSGGEPAAAMSWIVSQNRGSLDTEQSYPYTAGGGRAGQCDPSRGSPVANVISGRSSSPT